MLRSHRVFPFRHRTSFPRGIVHRAQLGSWVLEILLFVMLGLVSPRMCHAQDSSPSIPVIHDMFPLGVQAGTTSEVTIEVQPASPGTTLWVSHPDVQAERLDDTTFRLHVPSRVPPGVYDVAMVGSSGVSTPWSLAISRRLELTEGESSDTVQLIPLNAIVTGRISSAGETDRYHFDAPAGTRVLIQCSTQSFDSKLRAVVELQDSSGKRLHVDRGTRSLEPQIDFLVPTAGRYTVAIHDLTFTGSSRHIYRLSLDTGPRIEFARPSALQRGTANRVTLFGHNLFSEPSALRTSTEDFDTIEVEIDVPLDDQAGPLPALPDSSRAGLDWMAYDRPEMNSPFLFRLTDVPVVGRYGSGLAPEEAIPLKIPGEVCGEFPAGLGVTWFSVEAERGEVLWLEGFGQRLGAPVDLDLVVLDAGGSRELLHLRDQWASAGGSHFPTNHLDFSGRWVVPETGRYLLLLRNLHGATREDPRNTFQLGIRREERDFQLVVVPHASGNSASWNVPAGGRALAEVIALRRMGMSDPIHVTASDLPSGLEIDDVWLGPDVDRAPLIARAAESSQFSSVTPKLSGRAMAGGWQRDRPVQAGISLGIRDRQPYGRMTSQLLLGRTAPAPLEAMAYPSSTRIPQGGLVEIQVALQRRGTLDKCDVELEALYLPLGAASPLTTVSGESDEGWLTFALPSSLRPGPYTFVVRAVGTNTSKDGKKFSVTTWTNPISIEVYPAPFLVSLDPRTPRKIARGEIIQLNYQAPRQNGFIGKIHTELRASGGLEGLRGRGVTFVGGTESGVIQVIASDDAPLGTVPFLHLEAVGTVEDEPIYQSGCLIDLEIVPRGSTQTSLEKDA